MSVALVLAVVLSSVLAAAPQRAECPSLQVRNPDGNYIVPGVLGDIPYARGLALDAYVQQGERRRPAVVVVHGGGWTAGSRSAHVGQILELLTRGGFHWFSLDYRLGGLARYGDSLADLRAALAFIRCRAGELGIDRDQLVLLGEDSGAHLAALLAAERPTGVVGGILIGGFYDLAALPSMTRGLQPEAHARATPLTRIVPGMPPLLVVHGGADPEAPVEQARRYCDSVRQAKSECRFVDVAGASHRSENWWPRQWNYKREVVQWLAALSPAPIAPHQTRTGSVQKDIVYHAAAGLKLDAFVPRGGSPVPAVILVHGGGWEAGDKVTYVTPMFEPLARGGLAWFSIDYRLTPDFTHPEQLEDLREAIRFVRKNHARFNIDPDRIFLLGESASGQMVAQVASEDRSLAGVVSFYGVFDFPAMVTDASPRSLLVRLFRRHALDDDARELLRQYSPLYRAHKAMPPVLLVTGTADRLWPQTQAFATRLSELGVAHEVVALEGAPHGMENWEGRQWTSYKRRVVEWLLRRRHSAALPLR